MLAGYKVPDLTDKKAPKGSLRKLFGQIIRNPKPVALALLAAYGGWQLGEALIRYETKNSKQTITAMLNDTWYDDLQDDVIGTAKKGYRLITGDFSHVAAGDPTLAVMCITNRPYKIYRSTKPIRGPGTLITHYATFRAQAERNFMTSWHEWTIQARNGGFPVIKIGLMPETGMGATFKASADRQRCPRGWKEFDRIPLPELDL